MLELDIVALIIDPRTDGGVPVKCKLKNIGSSIQLHYGGLDGVIIQLPIKALQDVLYSEDLHG